MPLGAQGEKWLYVRSVFSGVRSYNNRSQYAPAFADHCGPILLIPMLILWK